MNGKWFISARIGMMNKMPQAWKSGPIAAVQQLLEEAQLS